MAILETLTLWHFILVFLLLAVPIFYQISRTFKYYLKLLIYYSLTILIGFGVCFYALPRPRDTKNHNFVTACVKLFLGRMMGVKVTIKGKEILEKDEPAVIVINHQSSIDMIPLFTLWPKNCVSLAKRELWLTGPFGLGAWLCGTIYINRLDTQSARKTMESAVGLIKNKKLKVAIFPEGTRNHHGSMLPFKKGAFHLAVTGQVPIIPVVFSSYDTFYSKPEKRFDEGTIIVEVLPPISTIGLGTEDVTALTETTRNQMLSCFERISKGK
ncbi:glutathione synthetase ATP-binding domain-like protein [Bulinus truncatus]|nr:glutathione synthetase ATP-binding domain-like protein [Bulinus truncatus]